jgi:hypothetical protein
VSLAPPTYGDSGERVLQGRRPATLCLEGGTGINTGSTVHDGDPRNRAPATPTTRPIEQPNCTMKVSQLILSTFVLLASTTIAAPAPAPGAVEDKLLRREPQAQWPRPWRRDPEAAEPTV